MYCKYQLFFCTYCLKNAGIHDLFCANLIMLYIFFIGKNAQKIQDFLNFFVYFVHNPLKYFFSKMHKKVLKKSPVFVHFVQRRLSESFAVRTLQQTTRVIPSKHISVILSRLTYSAICTKFSQKDPGFLCNIPVLYFLFSSCIIDLSNEREVKNINALLCYRYQQKRIGSF